AGKDCDREPGNVMDSGCPIRFDSLGCFAMLPPLFPMAKLTVRDLNMRGKRVLVRVDYNVPLEERDGQMVISDQTRMRETQATLELLVEQGARTILTSHLGRPEGRREPTMSLRPVAAKLADLVG